MSRLVEPKDPALNANPTRRIASPGRFFAVCLASSLAAMALIGAFNVLVDPYGEFDTRLVPLDDSDRHSRALKVSLLCRAAEPPEALILGNSRSMQLSPATVRVLTGLRTFNASTAAGSAFDLLAFTRLALARSRRLRTLIVGLDTFMLHAAHPRAELLYFPLVRYLPEMRSPLLAHLARAGRTTASSTAWLSAEQLYYLREERPRNYAFDADGKIRYLQYDEWVEEGRWFNPLPYALESVRSQYVGSFNVDPEPTEQASAALELWLAEADRANLDVYIFLPPLHSFLTASLERESRYREHMDAYRRRLQRLGGRFRFKFYDLATVDRFGGNDRWFLDGTHMIGPNNDLVLKAILKDVSRSGSRVAVR